MKSYKIEFEVTSREVYFACVEAESPEKALELWSDDPNQYDAEPDYTNECEDLVDTAEVTGEWNEDKDGNLSSLKRYDEPIKLKH